ncbi:xaa-Arg dipeptidase-like [Amblyomma americanum]
MAARAAPVSSTGSGNGSRAAGGRHGARTAIPKVAYKRLCVALLCEFDALPDIGHACGHNLIAEASIGAALAVQEAMKTHSDVHGKLIVLGTPAEESLGGKELLLSRGALHGIDAALMSHPSPADALRPPFAASQQLVIRFRGRSPHAAASSWDGLNALDAAVASYINISLLRQQCKPSWRINGVIAQGGKYANVIPEETVLHYIVRTETSAELLQLRGRVEACFRAAASATGCTVAIEEVVPYMHVIHKSAIAGAYRKHGHALGVSFAEDFVQKLQFSGASTDCGNVSHRVPTLHAVFSIGQRKQRSRAACAANHTRDFAVLANAATSQPPTLRAAKILALTVLDLLTDAQLMREAREEFRALRLPSNAELQQ